MRKIIKTKTEGLGLSFSVSIAILAALFLCGAVAGCVTASSISAESGKTLAEYVKDYVNLLNNGATYNSLFSKTAFNIFKYPVISFLLGFTALGVIFIPATVCVRGFFLSFSITSIIRMYGYKGLLLALSMFGISSLISIPCLLIISSIAFCAAISFLRVMLGGKRIPGAILPPGYMAVFGLCAVVLLICTVLDVFITPRLISLAASAIL